MLLLPKLNNYTVHEHDLNRPFPSSLVPQFQSESKCETILIYDFDSHENETAFRTHFHMKGFALRLALKQRHKRTRKWPIALALGTAIEHFQFGNN